MSSLHDFAREAEEQYRRLADLAESAGVASAASALRQKAARMQALLEGQQPASKGAAAQVYVVLTELQHHLDRVLKKWPPVTLAEAVNEVLAAADQLSQLGQASDEPQPPARPRRRWTAKDPPAATEPPSFPGPKKSPK